MNSKTKKRKSATVKVRRMLKADIPQVAEIEEKCLFEDPWDEGIFAECFEEFGYKNYVAEHKGKIVGYMVYMELDDSIEIMNLAIDPKHHRRSVGTQMLNALKGNLQGMRKDGIEYLVHADNLDGLRFLKSQKFRAVDICPTQRSDLDVESGEVIYGPLEENYWMRYTPNKFSPENRISKYWDV